MVPGVYADTRYFPEKDAIKMELRIARQADLPQLLEIYNYEVTHGVATLDVHPQTMEQRQAWFDAHNVDVYKIQVGLALVQRMGTPARMAFSTISVGSRPLE